MDGQKVRIGAGLLAENIEKMVRFYRDVLGISHRLGRRKFRRIRNGWWENHTGSVQFARPGESIHPLISAFAISTWPTRKGICWKSAA